MVSIGQGFWIEDGRRRKVFKVDGKALRVRGTLLFEDAHGQQLYKIQERMLRVRDMLNIENVRGGAAAKAARALDETANA